MSFETLKRIPASVRRAALCAGALAVTLATVHSPVRASDIPTSIPTPKITAPVADEHHLKLYNLHTQESLNVVYRIGDEYLPEAIDRLNHFLRDSHNDSLADYDVHEFDLLHALLGKLHRPDGVINIVCGYRTPETNHYLRTRSRHTGVAEHSQHMLSKAIDIRIPGVSTLALRNAALSLGLGGVGYYPVSQFVHVDVGPVREWSFGGRPSHTRRSSRHRSHRG